MPGSAKPMRCAEQNRKKAARASDQALAYSHVCRSCLALAHVSSAPTSHCGTGSNQRGTECNSSASPMCLECGLSAAAAIVGELRCLEGVEFSLRLCNHRRNQALVADTAAPSRDHLRSAATASGGHNYNNTTKMYIIAA